MSSTTSTRKPRKAAPKPLTTPPMTTEEAARKIALYDAPGFLDVQRARAALWLLEQIDGDQLTFSHDAMSAEDLGDWLRGIVKDAIGESLAAAEEKIADAVKEKVVA